MRTEMPPATPSATAFSRWLDRAPAGEAMIYYIGYLAADRMNVHYREGRLVTEKMEWVERLAQVVYAASKTGAVRLVQRRLGPGLWAYIAVKSKRRV